MDFLEKVKSLKLAELKELREYSFPKRKKSVLNPVVSLKEKPVIAEVKLASPSKGRIAYTNPVEKALVYEDVGAGAISVLTDKYFFSGSWEYLKEISDNVRVPVLCKDFIISELQIDMAFSCGADVILLINAFLSHEEAVRLSQYAKSKGLFVLFEIHHEDELLTLNDICFDMLGVNSRNLHTLEVNTDRAERVIAQAKESFHFVVAESGIKDIHQAERFFASGADALLIGEALMKMESPMEFIKEIRNVRESMRYKKR